MDYADITVKQNTITITFKSVSIDDKFKTAKLVERYKQLVLENTNIRLIVDCSKLISARRNIVIAAVKDLRGFEDANIRRFVDKTIVITKTSLRILANLIMKFFPPVVKTVIVNKL